MSYYVQRQRDGRPDYGPNDPPRQGWTGPIRSLKQAQREVEAWQEAGWQACALESTPEIRALVRAWEKNR